jgi:hypothetical protein
MSATSGWVEGRHAETSKVLASLRESLLRRVRAGDTGARIPLHVVVVFLQELERPSQQSARS